MRRALLLGFFAVLVVVLWTMWNSRFERVTGGKVWHLADIRAAAPAVPGVEWSGFPVHPVLRLRVDAANPQVAARFALPGATAVDFLDLRFRISAHGLIPGKEPWEDGRFVIEWHAPDDRAGWENDPVGSTRNDDHGEENGFVVGPQRASAIPALRVEHLGRCGEFEISDLEIAVVKERTAWRIGRWFLAGAWLAWGFFSVRTWPGIRGWQAALASIIWLLTGMETVIPGPWNLIRPLGGSFHFGSDPTAPPAASLPEGTAIGKSPVVADCGPIPAIGKLPEQGSFLLRVKLQLLQARPLLHALLFFAPALMMAFFVGGKPAVFLASSLALATEAAEVAFGYGFDLDDVTDLACDSVGIALAIWLYRMFVRKFKTLKR